METCETQESIILTQQWQCPLQTHHHMAPFLFDEHVEGLAEYEISHEVEPKPVEKVAHFKGFIFGDMAVHYIHENIDVLSSLGEIDGEC